MSRVPTWTRVQGDENDTLVVTLNGVDSLEPVTEVVARVSQRTSTDPATELTATVSDPVAREVTVQLSPWLDTANPDVWKMEVQATFISGESLTWPASAPATITVRRQLG